MPEERGKGDSRNPIGKLPGNTDDIADLVKTIASIAGSMIAWITKYPIPLGLIVTIGLIFYNKYFINPFKLSISDLRRHIAEARIEEEKLLRELEDIEMILERVERGEIKGDKELLRAKKKQLEEALKLSREKIRLASMIIMIKENMEVFNKLFGKDKFAELLNVEKLNEHVNEQLKENLRNVGIDALHQYFNNVFPLILRHPEEFAVIEEKKEEKLTQPSPQQVPPQQPRYMPVEQVDKMLRGGSIEEWIGIIKKAVESGEKIKMPPGRYESKEGYRNLLVALYIILEDVKPEKLREAIEDKFISRAIEYLEQLRKRPIEIPPESSDREYIDTILQIICGDPAKEEKTETETTKQYKLILKDREVVIERKIIIDPATKRAQKIVYSQRAPA
jgi:hypothetical protein